MIRDNVISEMNQRSRDILRHVIDAFMESGDPIGSKAISQRLGSPLSSSSIRSIMSDLETLGLLYAPHTSAGRLPTDAGLRLWVDGLLEVGRLDKTERENIDSRCAATGQSVDGLLEQATHALSGLSRCASLVMAPKKKSILKHIEFVPLGPGRALVVMVDEAGMVENRLIQTPAGMPMSTLIEAGNYLTSKAAGLSFDESRKLIQQELMSHQAQLDQLARHLVEQGLATWSDTLDGGSLIVRGQHNLLDDVSALGDLERLRDLFQTLERKESWLHLLDATDEGDGIQIFIGAESALFSNTGCSMIIAPYTNSNEQVLGAIGVIGPTRMNYARIIPMVDYTAQVISRLIG